MSFNIGLNLIIGLTDGLVVSTPIFGGTRPIASMIGNGAVKAL